MQEHTITASEKPLLSIFSDEYLFRIPSFQRPYAWEIEQTAELLDDILSACGNNGPVTEVSPYFLGSIVLIKEPLRALADVVDGQQRLTTLTILLSVLRDLADDGKVRGAIHNYVCQTGDPTKGTADVFRLTLRPRDADFFRSHIQEEASSGKLPDPRQFQDSRARLIENAAFLWLKLSELSSERRQRLAMYLAQRCFIVIVAASDQESAFRIFSVLNQRGLDLSPADVLKAEIIGALPAAKQDRYTEIWEDVEDELGRARFAELFSHIRMLHLKQKMQGTLIAEFRQSVPFRGDPSGFIDRELVPYANAYEQITDRKFESFKNSPEINRQLTHLSRLDNNDWQPAAIEAIARRRDDPDFLLHFFVDLERLAYGLFLMRRDPSERIRRYGRLLIALEANDDLFAPESALQLDEAEKKEVRDVLAGDIYSITRIRMPLLLRLDELLSGGSAVYTDTIITVEHVLPQNPRVGSEWIAEFPDPADRELWVHKLANLVLLTHRKNAQAGNLDFAEKKEKYFSTRAGISNFALTSKVLAEKTWTHDTLERRQAELLEAVRRLWRLE